LNVLATGISGFAGSHLADFLLQLSGQPLDIYGTYYREDIEQSHLRGVLSRLNLTSCDITNSQALKELLRNSKPDVIFHLAGISYVPQAEQEKTAAFQINAAAVHHLLEGVSEIVPKARVILISTSEVYGKVSPEEVPLTESHAVRPHNVYGASKAAMEIIAKEALASENLDIVILRAFNHIGPRQSDRFVVSNFARQIARIQLGLQEPLLRVGDLSPQRDFTDVRDIVRGYWMTALAGKKGEVYNICSGRACSIHEIPTRLSELAKVQPEMTTDPSRLRKNDLPVLQGSFQKLKADTGWEPEYSLEKSLKDILDYWVMEERNLLLGSA
jgi:GDP-4-dehydro-6-deoxy-D-mannose reductase